MARFSISAAPAASENTYVFGDVRVSVICDGVVVGYGFSRTAAAAV